MADCPRSPPISRSGLHSPIQPADWTGRDLGHFRLIEKIGEGGMGVVYRARDNKLGRDVAIKMLPAELSDDPQRLMRFRSEARVLAQINHPNVASIHGVEESEGRYALVMELVEGPTLADRIAKGALSVDEALPVAKQIAEAIEEAHSRGIVHRDLKPANVKVDRAGKVKVLDFGLARAVFGDVGPEEATLPAPTEPGIVVGTVAYMSPEQARGDRVDVRSDVWSFGVLLFEMLAGRRPFRGATTSDTMAAVLTEEPVWTALPSLPESVRDLLGRCLRKDRNLRLQSIGDARIAVQEVAESTLAESARASPLVPPSPRGEALAPLSFRVPLKIAAAALIGVAATWFFKPDSPRVERQVVRFSVPPPEGSIIRSFELSPDGRHLAFLAEHEDTARLWLRSFDEPAARPIEGADGLDPRSVPFWSPDSRTIGFFADRKLKKVGILGEPPIIVAEANAGRGGAWSEHGDIVFQPEGGTAHELTATTANGGEPRPATANRDATTAGLSRWPFFLPDGERFVFSSRIGPVGNDVEIRLGSMGSLKYQLLATRKSHAAPVVFENGAGSYLFLVESGVLMAYSFDGPSGMLSDGGIPVARDIGVDITMARAMFSVSPSGAFAHSAQTLGIRAPNKLVWLSRRGEPVETVLSSDTYSRILISPDQTRVAVGQVDYGSTTDKLVLLDLQKGSQFRPAPSLSGGPRGWSRDGAQLIHSSLLAIHRIAADASFEPEEIVVPRPAEIFVADWSRDGGWLLLADYAQGYDKWDLLKLRLPGGKPEPYLTSPYDVRDGRLSPDAGFAAYTSNEAGVHEIYVRSFPDPGSVHKVSLGGGMQPVWRQDGRELFFVAPDGSLMAAPIETGPAGFSSGRPQRLFRPGSRIIAYDVSADGERILASLEEELEQQPEPVHVVLDWDVELERLVAEREGGR